ncbi:hypothetical protein [Oryzomonas rubra]|uniref:Uncharacterized protein n=1 Tax=Oryzomonas rubra TaxID=2509454 RepID=A0A5A9XGA9_9BACT|nr:hypothetical protein [Oryzomonas rubra]KAA0891643.1 hypothetical protein ET418_09345 [Oryzomonas rubra]
MSSLSNKESRYLEDSYMLAALQTLYSDTRFKPVIDDKGWVGFKVFIPNIDDKIEIVACGEEAPLMDYIGKLKSLKSLIHTLKFGRRGNR